ncbi:hypothetical protein ACFQ0X_12860 [Streptomyces rectiviolaceus]|uniref:MFS transporter n=1 Tax=Streptomyces rectiviolaceus TaxID=332591 RepID=A0ABP6N3S6_9ACTN
MVTLAARLNASLADSAEALHAATEGFSLALTIAAALLVLGAVLIATLLGSHRSGSAADARETPAQYG